MATQCDVCFEPSQFTPTKFTSAAKKAQFANDFVAFVESNFAWQLFSQSFYRQLSNTFAHIAHYDRHGFFQTFFEDVYDKLTFLTQCVEYTPVGDPAWTYSDVERELQSWLATSGEYEKLQNRVMERQSYG